MKQTTEKVILVDEANNMLGTMEKMEAHRKGKLHRAFSIYLVNSQNELLLQKRAASKYHSGGLWTNTCCGHPRLAEEVLRAANRRLHEEMGIWAKLVESCSFRYQAVLDHEMTEHEFLHVFVGQFEETPTPNDDEVEDWKWQSMEDIRQEVAKYPERFTEWFKITLPLIAESALQK